MKRIANSLIAGCIVLLIAGCSQRTNIGSQTRRTVDTYDIDLFEKLDGELKALSRGVSLLLAMNRESDRFTTLTDFLATIDAGQLRCEIRELEYYPLVLYIYHTSYYLPDGSYRPTLDRKSALVLVDAKTHRVIDFTFETGYRTDAISSQEPYYEGSWDRKDGTTVTYRLLPSGFEVSKAEEQGK